jgi:hypothetical protein
MNKAQMKRMAFIKFDSGETVRGKGFKKKTWYSICSIHAVHNKNCNMCNTGNWQNNFMLAISGCFHDHVYWLWYFWVNNI